MALLERIIKQRVRKDMALLIHRILLGGLMLTHGYGKLVKLINGNLHFIDPIGIGELPTLLLTIFAEFVCAIFIMFGFMTRLSVIPLLLTMIAAAVVAHGVDPIAEKENALLYISGLIVLLYTGGGNYSVDRMIYGSGPYISEK